MNKFDFYLFQAQRFFNHSDLLFSDIPNINNENEFPEINLFKEDSQWKFELVKHSSELRILSLLFAAEMAKDITI